MDSCDWRSCFSLSSASDTYVIRRHDRIIIITICSNNTTSSRPAALSVHTYTYRHTDRGLTHSLTHALMFTVSHAADAADVKRRERKHSFSDPSSDCISGREDCFVFQSSSRPPLLLLHPLLLILLHPFPHLQSRRPVNSKILLLTQRKSSCAPE